MSRRAIGQTVGAILLGLNVALPTALDAQSIFPLWNWQQYALIGFAAFCAFIGWIIYSKQSQINKYESGRPELILGDYSGAGTKEIEGKSQVKVSISISFRNVGKKPAYQFCLRMGYSPYDKPGLFKHVGETTSANRIDSGGTLEYGEEYNFVEPYIEKNGRKVVGKMGWMIYCLLSYRDLHSGGRLYTDEYWFSYRFEYPKLATLSIQKKEELEQYVRQVYQAKQLTIGQVSHKEGSQT